MTSPVLLLGKGYTGSFLLQQLHSLHRPAVVATRHPNTTDELFFELSDQSTWDALPLCPAVVWLFPPTPLEHVRALAGKLFEKTRTLVVIGTTSSFLPQVSDAVVDESTPLNPLASRVLGEEYLRSRGAIVLRSAGIYGPAIDSFAARDPIDWMKRGLIGSSRQFLNVIHVIDLAGSIIAAIDGGKQGEQYIVSDGVPRRQEEILAQAKALGLISDVPFMGGRGQASKQLSNEKMRRELGVEVSVTLKDYLILRAQPPAHRP